MQVKITGSLLYLAGQIFKSIIMAMQTILLNAFYNGGDKIAPIVGYLFILLMVIEMSYVFVKYVITSNK